MSNHMSLIPNLAAPVQRTNRNAAVVGSAVTESGIACTLCKAACSQLSGLAKTACTLACNNTVC